MPTRDRPAIAGRSFVVALVGAKSVSPAGRRALRGEGKPCHTGRAMCLPAAQPACLKPAASIVSGSARRSTRASVTRPSTIVESPAGSSLSTTHSTQASPSSSTGQPASVRSMRRPSSFSGRLEKDLEPTGQIALLRAEHVDGEAASPPNQWQRDRRILDREGHQWWVE